MMAAFSFASEPTDSLAYEAKRRQILENAPDERATLILGAAQELARDGFHAEALDLIYSMQDTVGGQDWEGDFDSVLSAGQAPQLPIKAPGAFTSGYVQASVDYEEWEHLDTLVGGRIRAKLEWDPKGRLIDRVSTVFQGSDRNAYFDLSGKGSAMGGLLKWEGDGLVEKRFPRLYGDSLTRRDYGDSLDRVFLQAKLEGNTRRFGKPLSVVVPTFAETDAYRHDRVGYYSYRAYGAGPGLEAVSEDLRKTLILSWDLRRTEYPSSPSASNLRNGPVALGEWYGERIALDAESRFINYGYDRDTSLTRISRLETRAGLFVRTWPWLKIGVRTVGESETDAYVDTVDLLTLDRLQARYSLEGSLWSVRPQVVAEWASTYSASLGMSFARGDYPVLDRLEGRTLLFPLYQNYSADDWKAEAGFSILSKAIFFTVSLDYEENWVAHPEIYRQGSSKGVGLDGNLFWKIRRWFEIDVSCNATRRIWLARGYASGNIVDVVNLSLGLSSRFQ
jgi:hypothetical protein